jgi:hypothetical protein
VIIDGKQPRYKTDKVDELLARITRRHGEEGARYRFETPEKFKKAKELLLTAELVFVIE